MIGTLKKPGKSTISATALARINTCSHFWYLQCYGDATQVAEPNAGAKLRIEAGISHEEEIVSQLQVVMPNYPEDNPWKGIEPTLKLMKEGVPLIYQGVLLNSRVFGLPDLLEKTKGKSKLGSYSYIPVDIKSHAKVTPKDKLQLAAYAYMLKGALGFVPGEGAIILKDKSRVDVKLDVESGRIENALARALAVEKKKIPTLPLRCSECGMCPWSDFCDSDRRDRKLVTVIAGIDNALTRKLVAGGVETIDQLIQLGSKELASKYEVKQARVDNILINAKAWQANKPILKSKIILPPTKQTVIHYDIETFGESVYLHGLSIGAGKKSEIKQFAAQTPAEEEKILGELLDFLNDYNGVIYSWTQFENGWMKTLAERYPKHAKAISRVLKQFVDLKEVVKGALALPVTTFSIKEVAPVFGFSWRADDAGGSNSEAWYDEWLKTGDKKLFTKILNYNADDVIAMDVIMTALSDIVRKTNQIRGG